MLARPADARFGVRAGALTFAGVLLSGPAGVALVGATAPQPPWVDAETFVRHYHPMQLVPYVFGFALVFGSVMLIASLYPVAEPSAKARALLAVVMVAVFASFVFLNYALQTTVVPELARHFRPSVAPAIALLSMSNPRSLAWTLEMWGYGFLGAATWLAAPVLAGEGIERVARTLFVLNGIASIGSALATLGGLGWLAAPVGLVAFGVWNVLVAALAAVSILVWRRAREP